MTITDKIKAFIAKPFFQKYTTVFALWMLLPLIVWLTRTMPVKYNNFLIFRESFWHAINHLSLYGPYPDQYNDVFLYGPLFSLLVAPFAVTPVKAGLLTWALSLSFSLFIATRNLPVSKKKLLFIYWFTAHELLTGLFMWQFNIGIAAIIIASYICIEKEKDFWSAFFIVLGTVTKLYGIIGLAFFFFSKHKLRFIISGVFWLIVLLALPALFFGPEYTWEQYLRWIQELTMKNESNLFSLKQNVSLLGMVRKISGSENYSDLWLIIPGIILFCLPYLRISQYKNAAFRLTYLASVLLFVVLFSTGSESSTYIIPFMGVAIWYVAAPWKRSRLDIGLMVFAFILTSMSPSDLFPKYIRVTYVYPYALKALPCALIWFKLSYELCTRDYLNTQARIR